MKKNFKENRVQYSRWQTINDLFHLRYPHVVTKEELIERCDVSERTIKEDIANLLIKGAPIVFDRKAKGWKYTNKEFDLEGYIHLNAHELAQLDFAVQTLDQFETLPIFKDIRGIFQKIKKAIQIRTQSDSSPFIYFEKVPAVKGIHLLPFFMDAIESKSVVQLNYVAYSAPSPGIREFHPYIVKEHQNRWYVIGNLPKYQGKIVNKITTYALDRVQHDEHLQKLNRSFMPLSEFNHNDYFKFCYGITNKTENPIEEVMLWLNPLSSDYFQSKPFFPFQIVERNDSGTIVKMRLRLNDEFEKKLISYGTGLKVISPIHLQESIKQKLLLILKHYDC